MLEMEGDRGTAEWGIPQFGYRKVFQVGMDFFLRLQESMGYGLEEVGYAGNGAAHPDFKLLTHDLMLLLKQVYKKEVVSKVKFREIECRSLPE